MSSLLRPKLSIHQKLIGLIVVTVAAIVVFLTVYFPTQQIRQLRNRATNRVATYGALLSEQLKSAVAFGDHETAREVLDSLAADPDVVAVVLFGDDRSQLYAHGTPDAWVARAAGGVVAARVVRVKNRVAAVSPVISREGPRGTLVIELATSQIRSDQRTVIVTAVVIGGLALLGGVAAAWWIARSLARRLRAIARVASAVADGDIAQPMVVDTSNDEIGAVATAFNGMLAQLRTEQSVLEARVMGRTAQLASANVQLRDEMTRRNQIEIELRQAQKLESVGRLASGVAHEINTPIQFVSDSVHFVRGALNDICTVLDKHRASALRVAEGELAQALAREALEAETEVDLPFLCQSIPEALGRAVEGVERVVKIVRSMKEFAHPDQAEMEETELNAAVTSTLTIARNEYKYVADLETELGDLPPVCCYVGEINQVLLNLVINAAHAISDVVKGTEDRGVIRVVTRVLGASIEIAIADTGGGIPEAIQDRIFDPFFTTKEVGRGTGQGLAIARSVIVDKHHGSLTYETTMGKGTTFFVRIPVEQGREAAA